MVIVDQIKGMIYFHWLSPELHFFLLDYLHSLLPASFHLSYLVLFFLTFSFLCRADCSRLSWPSRQLSSAHIHILVVSYHIIVIFRQLQNYTQEVPVQENMFLKQLPALCPGT